MGKPVVRPRYSPEALENLTERFWPKVQVGANDECWEWQGARFPRGYGQMRNVRGYKPEVINAHRVSVIINYGDYPDERFVCHACDNPPCVNPLHLFLGTPQQNALDMISKGRAAHQRHPGAFLPPRPVMTAETFRLTLQSIPDATERDLARIFGVSKKDVWEMAVQELRSSYVSR